MARRFDRDAVLARTNYSALFHELVPGFKHRGTNSLALCPFHEDKTPSWNGNVDTGLWICHACGEKGDAIALVEKRQGLDFQRALEWLADRSGTEPQDGPRLAVVSKPSDRKRVAAPFDRLKDGALKQAEYSYGDRWLKVRYEHPATGKKSFLWFERVGAEWLSGLAGAHPGVYVRGGDLAPAIGCGGDIWLHEGEKAVDRFAAASEGRAVWPVALCGHTGAKSFSAHGANLAALLKGARRVIAVVDRDAPGRAWARDVRRAREGQGEALRFVSTPAGDGPESKTDAYDHFELGLGLDDFVEALIDEPAAETKPQLAGTITTNGETKPAPTPPMLSDDENLTDLGNCRLMRRLHGQDLRYVPGFGWHTWEQGRWQEDETGAVERMAKAVCGELNRYAWLQQTEDQRKKALSWALKSEGAPRIKAMIELVRSEPSITIPARQLDAGAWLVNTPTGVLDLQSGRLREHRREDLQTKWTRTPYDAEAQCPRFLAFLHRIMGEDEELVSFLQRAFGYSLSGSTREQKLFLCYGTGSNGKSTLMEVLRKAFGDYARAAPFESFCESFHGGGSSGPNEDIARLAGARFVSAVEGGASARLNEGLVKQLTGGDVVVASFKYRSVFEYQPAFKIWLSSNHKPRIQGTDEGIWRRVCLIPFEAHIPDEEKDHELPAKLAAEAPGILSWAVQGALRWQRDGLRPPTRVIAATTDYRAESDVLGQFLEDCCEVDRIVACKASELYAAYRRWCEDNGNSPMSQTSFGKRLQERGFEPYREAGGDRVRMWRGLIVVSNAQSSRQGTFRRDWD